jgi:hypothetical protein
MDATDPALQTCNGPIKTSNEEPAHTRIRLDEDVGAPDATNFIFRQTHFIKSVEDSHETLVGAVPGIKFGLTVKLPANAWCEAPVPMSRWFSLLRRTRSLAQQLMSGVHVDGLSSKATTIVAQGYSTIFVIVGVPFLVATLTAWLLISKKDTAPVPVAPANAAVTAE